LNVYDSPHHNNTVHEVARTLDTVSPRPMRCRTSKSILVDIFKIGASIGLIGFSQHSHGLLKNYLPVKIEICSLQKLNTFVVLFQSSNVSREQTLTGLKEHILIRRTRLVSFVCVYSRLCLRVEYYGNQFSSLEYSSHH